MSSRPVILEIRSCLLHEENTAIIDVDESEKEIPTAIAIATTYVWGSIEVEAPSTGQPLDSSLVLESMAVGITSTKHGSSLITQHAPIDLVVPTLDHPEISPIRSMMSCPKSDHDATGI
ncbi:hypothetical protein HAX54_031194 [Datura stramonium]|uniref:Uncharacterized protein n=1 Tax=Datura stramonium TaxID=4076 RepID=A0ABS8YAD5_DATST|nr:hypothetical protein [Datura stramonium]